MSYGSRRNESSARTAPGVDGEQFEPGLRIVLEHTFAINPKTREISRVLGRIGASNKPILATYGDPSSAARSAGASAATGTSGRLEIESRSTP